jgi:hypothetical protein
VAALRCGSASEQHQSGLAAWVCTTLAAKALCGLSTAGCRRERGRGSLTWLSPSRSRTSIFWAVMPLRCLILSHPAPFLELPRKRLTIRRLRLGAALALPTNEASPPSRLGDLSLISSWHGPCYDFLASANSPASPARSKDHMAKALNQINQAVAEKICIAQGALASRKWGTLEHNSALRNVACEALRRANAEAGKDGKPLLADAALAPLLAAFRPIFMTSCEADGMGGNASQFRQRLVEHALLPKSTAAEIKGYD